MHRSDTGKFLSLPYGLEFLMLRTIHWYTLELRLAQCLLFLFQLNGFDLSQAKIQMVIQFPTHSSTFVVIWCRHTSNQYECTHTDFHISRSGELVSSNENEASEKKLFVVAATRAIVSLRHCSAPTQRRIHCAADK